MASDQFEALTITNQRLNDDLRKKNSLLEESQYELRTTRHKIEKLYLDAQFSDMLLMHHGGGNNNNSNHSSTGGSGGNSHGGSGGGGSCIGEYASQDGGSSYHVNGGGIGGMTGSGGSSGSSGNPLLDADRDVQIAELKKMLRSRKAHIKEQTESIARLEQENHRLKMELINETQVPQTSTFKNLLLNYQHQLCFVRQENHAKNELFVKLEEMKKLNADESAQMKAQFDAIIGKYQERETVMSSEMSKLKQQYNEMDIRVKEETEKANRLESINKKYDELQKRYDKKRKDFDNLMRDHEKVKRLLEKVQKQLRERGEVGDSASSSSSSSSSTTTTTTSTESTATATTAATTTTAEASKSSTGDDIEALKLELKNTKEQLEDKIEETQMYATELEEVSSSFGKLQEQVAKQKKQLDQKEQRITDLLKEQIEMKKMNDAFEIRINIAKQAQQTHMNQVQLLTEQVRVHQQRADDLERRFNENQQEMMKIHVNFERMRVNQKTKDTEHRELSLECERIKKAFEVTTSRADELQAKFGHVSNELKFKKEKIESLEKRLKVMSSHGATKDLEGELLEYKRMVTCSVCQTRNKDVMIQRCHHTFCNECIQENLKVRNRKCPICAIKFGSDDVKPVYL